MGNKCHASFRFLLFGVLIFISATSLYCGGGGSSDTDAPSTDDESSISGIIDTTFDLTHDGLWGTVSFIELLPDGKFLAGGINTPHSHQAAPCGIMRFNSDGSVDSTFNQGGVGVSAYVEAVALLANDQMLVAGLIHRYNDVSVPHNIIRLNGDGELDLGFNEGGTGTDAPIRCLAVQSDGKILIGGRISMYNGHDAPNGIMRLNPDGSPDAGFNVEGPGISIETVPNTVVGAIALQPDGSILAGGVFTTYNGIAVPNGLIRLTSSGAIDNTFNETMSGFGDGAYIAHIVVEDDGAILVGGRFDRYNDAVIPNGIVRLNADGSFNAAMMEASTTGTVEYFEFTADGSILACGYFSQVNNRSVPNGIVRLNSDWTLDSSFNAYGLGSNSTVTALGIQPDHKILIGGFFNQYNGTDVSFPLLRLYP